MKRIFALLLALVCFFSVSAFADLPDISSLSFDELVALQNEIMLTMWKLEEWQEVTVPAGTYKIGESIPAGHWSLRVAAKHDSFNVFYFDVLDDVGKKPGYGSKLYSEQIATSDFTPFNSLPITSIDIDMQEGWYIYLGGETVFTPYAGVKDFGFKK